MRYSLMLSEVKAFPVLTVDNSIKWGGMYIVREEDVQYIHFGELEDYFRDGSAYLDHVPNPEAVLSYAIANGYRVDQFAMREILRRWRRDHA